MSKCFITGQGFYPVCFVTRAQEGGGFITTLVYFVSRCSIARLNILDIFLLEGLKGTLLIRAET